MHQCSMRLWDNLDLFPTNFSFFTFHLVCCIIFLDLYSNKLQILKIGMLEGCESIYCRYGTLVISVKV